MLSLSLSLYIYIYTYTCIFLNAFNKTFRAGYILYTQFVYIDFESVMTLLLVDRFFVANDPSMLILLVTHVNDVVFTVPVP